MLRILNKKRFRFLVTLVAKSEVYHSLFYQQHNKCKLLATMKGCFYDTEIVFANICI